MQIILLERVSRLGAIGDIVNVTGGYGRNYLVPAGKAIRATKENLADFKSRRAALEKINDEQKEMAEQNSVKLQNIIVRIVGQASESGKLYGSISVRDIANALSDAGHKVERRLIDLTAAIKELGRHKATITLHPEVKVEFFIDVVHSINAPGYGNIKSNKTNEEAAA